MCGHRSCGPLGRAGALLRRIAGSGARSTATGPQSSVLSDKCTLPVNMSGRPLSCYALLCAVFILNSASAQDAEYVQVPEFGKSYRVHGLMNWAGAASACREFGGRLWAPRSPDELRRVLAALNLARSTSPWIGYSDVNKDGSWVSTTGEKLPASLHLPISNEQNNCTSVDHVGSLGIWDCSEVSHFICEATLLDRLKTPISSYVGFKYLGAYRTLYKLHSDDLDWQGASLMCAKERGRLWAPTLEGEAMEVVRLLNIMKIIPWVGLKNVAEEGLWTTEEGKPALYLTWKEGKPSDNAGKNCAAIDARGLLSSFPCQDTGSFICKAGLADTIGNSEFFELLNSLKITMNYMDSKIATLENNMEIRIKNLTERISNEESLTKQLTEAEKRNAEQYQIQSNQLSEKEIKDNQVTTELRVLLDQKVENLKKEFHLKVKRMTDINKRCETKLAELNKAIRA